MPKLRGLGTITLNRTPLNILNLKMMNEINDTLKDWIKAGLIDDLEPSLKIIEDIYLKELMRTADAQEGLQAFLERRSPEWKNC
jgi:cyclohexa-1,5-dienecarbonyl-CoA hydratase